VTGTIFTVDPVSGKHLVFGREKQVYEYDVTTDTWSELSGRPTNTPLSRLGRGAGGEGTRQSEHEGTVGRRLKGAEPPIFTFGPDLKGSAVFGCAATPLSNHGVVMFVRYERCRAGCSADRRTRRPIEGSLPQVLDWGILHGENAHCCRARYAAEVAALTSYGGVAPAAEFEVSPHRKP